MPSRRKPAAGQAVARAAGGPGLPPEHVVRGMYSMEGGHAAASRLLDAGVTGIIALGAVRAARRRGLRVPQDVSVVGYDDSPLMTLTEPPLSTVRQQPIDALGRTAVQLLTAQIDGREVVRDEILLEPELIVRGSTGPRAAR